MRVNGETLRTIWVADDGYTVEIIDQTRLPHEFVVVQLKTWRDAAQAISTMQVRGAPLIGVTGVYGICLAMLADTSDTMLNDAADGLKATRPTGADLSCMVDDLVSRITPVAALDRLEAAYVQAADIADGNAKDCHRIGENGLALIRKAYDQKGNSGSVNILTHCNAGWLATVDWGTAISPIYHAYDAGIPVHIWVDETRPRNQGASLTAWELGQHGVPHTVIVDNAGGHLMQHGRVDLCITGSDRTTCTGDVCNKIGTYLKALAAHDNKVPFYVALPSTTIDWSLRDGVTEIPIEERGADEVARISGRDPDGRIVDVVLVPEFSKAENFAFDVTPSRLVSALITERGICPATEEGILGLYPEHKGGDRADV